MHSRWAGALPLLDFTQQSARARERVVSGVPKDRQCQQMSTAVRAPGEFFPKYARARGDLPRTTRARGVQSTVADTVAATRLDGPVLADMPQAYFPANMALLHPV
jgi:hypothetical protein